MAKDLVTNVCTLGKLVVTLLVLDEVAEGLNHGGLQDRGHGHLVVGVLVVNLKHARQEVEKAGRLDMDALRGEDPVVLLSIHDANEVEHSDGRVDLQRNYRLHDLALVFLLVGPGLLDEWLGKHVLVDDFEEEIAEVWIVVGRPLLLRVLCFFFLGQNVFVSRVHLVENLIVLEPVFEDFEKLGGFFAVDLLDGHRQEVLDLGEEARFARPRPLLGDDLGVVLAEGLEDLDLFV